MKSHQGETLAYPLPSTLYPLIPNRGFMATIAPRRNPARVPGTGTAAVASSPLLVGTMAMFSGPCLPRTGRRHRCVLFATYLFYDIKKTLPSQDQLVGGVCGAASRRYYATDKDRTATVSWGEVYGHTAKRGFQRDSPTRQDATVAMKMTLL